MNHRSLERPTLYYPIDTRRKLNVHKTFRRRPRRLLNVLCTFNLRPVSKGYIYKETTNIQKVDTTIRKATAMRHFYPGASDYKAINNLFGIGHSTVYNIVGCVSKTIVDDLLPQMIF